MWMFAALAIAKPPIVGREQVAYTEARRPWFAARLPLLEARIRLRPDDRTRWRGHATGWRMRSARAT